MPLYRDRAEAGARLAAELAGRDLADPVVLGLPRGGVPVAAPVAAALGAPLDVLVARKIGAPGQPELGVGAVAEGGDPVWNTDLLDRLGLTPERLAPTVERERLELVRRVFTYRGDRAPVDVRGRTAVLVDDGLATGITARAAVAALRARAAALVVVAVPVAAPGVDATLDADEVIALAMPWHFSSVGTHYGDFRQTTDDEVIRLLTP